MTVSQEEINRCCWRMAKVQESWCDTERRATTSSEARDDPKQSDCVLNI